MLYHQNTPEESQLEFFSRYLDEYLVRKNEKFRPIIDKVIADAHYLSTGQKNAFAVSREFALVIFYLEENYKSFFKDLKENGYDDDTYLKVRAYLSPAIHD